MDRVAKEYEENQERIENPPLAVADTYASGILFA